MSGPRQERPRRRIPALLLAAALYLLAAAVQGARAGSPPDRTPGIRIRSDHGLMRIDASTHADCTPEEAWAVVLDYNRLPQYVSTLDSSRIVGKHGEALLVHQVGSTRFVFRKRFRFDLEFQRLDPERVQFHQVKGDFREFSGIWGVAPEGTGVSISFDASMGASWSIPRFLVKSALRRQTQANMSDLVREIGRRRLLADPHGGKP